MAESTHTNLNQPWLGLARFAWAVIVLISLALLTIGTWDKFQAPLPENCLVEICNPIEFTQADARTLFSSGFSEQAFTFLGPLFNLLFNAGFVVSGLFLGWRKSRDWLALLLSATWIVLGCVAFSPANDVLHRTRPELGLVANWLQQPAYFGLIVLLAIFPDGRFVPRWSAVIFLPLSLTFLGWFGSAELSIQVASVLNIPLYLLTFIILLVSQTYRYRKVSTAVQRQQTKWGLLGISGAFFIMFLWSIIANIFPPQDPNAARAYALVIVWPIFVLSGVVMPVSLAIAVLRYKLWDIDLIIRKTLLYATVTGILALLYFGAVVLTQSILGSLTGNPESPLVVVLSTLAIAALINPLRSRIQDLIDKRFYRARYNAEQALEQFATTARDEVDMEKLSAVLMGVVEKTMQPEHVRLWVLPERRKSDV